MKIEEHYRELGKAVNSILEKSLSEDDKVLLSSNHSSINDFAAWLDVLKDRPEASIITNALKEYQIAMLSNSLGLYQQAFMGLRFFLERSLVAIMFSGNEVELNLWKLGERDTYWNELMDKDKGVFSNKFCRAFFPELKEELKHMDAITIKVYRECSEYVHGNSNVIKEIPNSLEYSKILFDKWNSKADIIKRVILFAFCLRYLKHLKEEQVKQISGPLLEEFVTVKPIIAIINK